MPPYRILVVDDSAFMRKFVADIITEDPSFTVVSTAVNGREAIEAVRRLRPDCLTLDVEMPVMSGLETLPILMKESPLPVIMMSSPTQQGTELTIKALELGAFDFVSKPSGQAGFDPAQFRSTLQGTLRAAVTSRKPDAAVKLAPPLSLPPPPKRIEPAPKREKPPPSTLQPRARLQPDTPLAAGGPEPGKKPPPILSSKLVAIGTSTGGPRALQTILTQIPGDFPAPILIVQHMPAGFTRSLAQRLNTLCSIRVTEAEDGMEPTPGTAYIAPGGRHMTLTRDSGRSRLRTTSDPPRNGHRPSVDVLFESLLEFKELERTVVLLTGMGADGAKGMKLLYDSGVTRTFAEDQSSCVVYGMPRAAVELGCVNRIIPLDRLANVLTKCVSHSEEV